MKVQVICVLGAGQMGTGIAQIAAESGFKVIIRDIDDKSIARGMNTIKGSIERAVAKSRIDANRGKEILDNITVTLDLATAKDADLVIEAVPEDENLKKEIYAQLDKICKRDTIFASNTSTIPITGLAGATTRPDKVIGTHFINPVRLMKLVEFIRGFHTSDDTFDTAKQVVQQMGKEIIIAKDCAGFATVRVMMPSLNEAAYLIYEGIISKEDLDKSAKMINPVGPFEQMDYIGIDSVVNIMNILYKYYGNPKYFPCPLLTQMVQAGRLGMKTGKGFYEYPPRTK